MAWRQITKEDVKRGVIIRDPRMIESGSYGMATIISTREVGEKNAWPHITVARPYAYAHEHFDANHPLMGAEVYSIGLLDLFREGIYQVYQARDEVRSMVT
jgi:hypothetical protein